jgi:hypothetical protein
MKTIKKYWALITGSVITLFAIFASIFSARSKNKITKIDQKIDQNNSDIDKIKGKIEVIDEQKDKIKKDIKIKEQAAEKTKEAKDNIVVETPKTVKSAKQNILNKTTKKKKIKS